MRIGGWLFLIAVGAILRWAVHEHIKGIDVHTVGVILLIIGIVGMVVELALWMSRRRTTVVTRAPGATYLDPADPVDRY